MGNGREVPKVFTENDSEESEGIPTMRKTTRKLTAVLLSAVCTLTAALPVFSCECAAAEIAAETGSDVKIVSYTVSEALAALIDEIEKGGANLYLDKDRTQPAGLAVDDREDNSLNYYAFTNSGVYTTGKQCYIYSQAVYGKLFDELPLHGVDPKAPYKYSEQAAGFAETLTPEFLTANSVMPGAYFRTKVNTDGSYSSKGGHSMILLGYDRDTIHLLEGNGDGYGLIRDVVLTYEQFNRIYITRKGRYVGNIIQPTAQYYKTNFGLVFSDFPDAPPDEPMPVSGGWSYEPQDQPADSSEEKPEEESADSAEKTPEDESTDKMLTVGISMPLLGTASPKSVRGDVDGDGEVTANDAKLALRGFNEYLAETEAEDRTLTADQEAAGDVDGDGELTAFDATCILVYFNQTVAEQENVTWENIIPS